MSGPQPNGHPDEQRLVKLYMDLTGQPESGARSVIMYLDAAKEQSDRDSQPSTAGPLPTDKNDAAGPH